MVNIDPGKAVICKKCGKPMSLIAESEKLSDGTRRVSFYYKCNTCGYRLDIEQVFISVEKDAIAIRRVKRVISS